MRFVSCLSSIVIFGVVLPASPLRAAGLYQDFFSFFSAADTAKTRLVMRQAELERRGWRASLLGGEVAFRIGRRYVVRYRLEVPAIRAGGDITYGVGDMAVLGAARIAGDTLDASGLFLRLDARIPTGSKELRPFCNASLDGGAGLEARFAVGPLAVRGAALYTLVGERIHEIDFQNDNYVTLAASAKMEIPGIGEAGGGASLVRLKGGASRQIFLCSLDRGLSSTVILGVAGAFEAGGAADRLFDSSVSLSLTYRFPPRPRPEIRKPATP